MLVKHSTLHTLHMLRILHIFQDVLALHTLQTEHILPYLHPLPALHPLHPLYPLHKMNPLHCVVVVRDLSTQITNVTSGTETHNEPFKSYNSLVMLYNIN